MMPPSFVCPRCQGELEPKSATELGCQIDNLRFNQVDGIWRFLLPEREAYFQQFMHDYETIRRAEGRQSEDAAYYRHLPEGDGDWRIRAKSYQTLIKKVIKPRETDSPPLTILDMGAGNCWLSHRLAERGHSLSSVDLQTNSWDGLGAHVHYPVAFTPIQTEFDRLPFDAGQFDLVIFNSSFHYSEDYLITLRESLRCLKHDGQVIILDSPVYRDSDSGEQMVREREDYFKSAYGLRSDELESESFLTYSRLDNLGQELDISWEFHRPFYGIRWLIRPIIARLRKSREPAQFGVIIGRRRKQGANIGNVAP